MPPTRTPSTTPRRTENAFSPNGLLCQRASTTLRVHSSQAAVVSLWNGGSTNASLARYIEQPIRRKGAHSIGVVRDAQYSQRQSRRISPSVSAGHLLLAGGCNWERAASLRSCMEAPKRPKSHREHRSIGKRCDCTGSARIQVQMDDASADDAAASSTRAEQTALSSPPVPGSCSFWLVSRRLPPGPVWHGKVTWESRDWMRRGVDQREPSKSHREGEEGGVGNIWGGFSPASAAPVSNMRGLSASGSMMLVTVMLRYRVGCRSPTAFDRTLTWPPGCGHAPAIWRYMLQPVGGWSQVRAAYHAQTRFRCCGEAWMGWLMLRGLCGGGPRKSRKRSAGRTLHQLCRRPSPFPASRQHERPPVLSG